MVAGSAATSMMHESTSLRWKYVAVFISLCVLLSVPELVQTCSDSCDPGCSSSDLRTDLWPDITGMSTDVGPGARSAWIDRKETKNWPDLHVEHEVVIMQERS